MKHKHYLLGAALLLFGVIVCVPLLVGAVPASAPPVGATHATFNSVTSTTFKDKEDDSYYLDPASTSKINALELTGNTTTSGNITSSDYITTTDGINTAAIYPNGGIGTTDGTHGILLAPTGNIWVEAEGAGGMTLNQVGNGGLTINSTTGGLRVNSSTTGGIELNSPVRVNDAFEVNGDVRVNGHLRANRVGGYAQNWVHVVPVSNGGYINLQGVCSDNDQVAVSCSYETRYFTGGICSSTVAKAGAALDTVVYEHYPQWDYSSPGTCKITLKNNTGATRCGWLETRCYDPSW
jgi:hypothetical protein